MLLKVEEMNNYFVVIGNLAALLPTARQKIENVNTKVDDPIQEFPDLYVCVCVSACICAAYSKV